jgi:hypothetical protein
MVNADKVRVAIELDKNDLARMLSRSGYSGLSFNSSQFLGITNGNEFCYSVQFYSEAGTDRQEQAKVFVRCNNATGDFVAEI